MAAAGSSCIFSRAFRTCAPIRAVFYVHRSPAHVGGNPVGDVAGMARAHRAFAQRFRLVEHGYLRPHLSVGDPGNGVPLAALTERVRVDIAYGGSCAAGRREDFDHYHEVLAWAASRGLRVAPGVTLYLQFGTAAVRDHCAERGYLAAFEAVGAEILQPACDACANCGPGSSTSTEQITVSAINRNFPGRSGPGQVGLASPPTVAASAIAGRLVSYEELRRGRYRSIANGRLPVGSLGA